MKHRLIAMLLVLCLCLGLIPMAAAANSFDDSVNVDAIVAAGKKMFSAHEGDYGSVVKSDSGAVGMGIMGWRGPKALELMKLICAKAPDYSKSVLGTTFYNEIVNASATAWNYRTFNDYEASVASTVLASSTGIAAQEELARKDITTQINNAWKAGVRTDAAILYYCSVENHYGPGGAITFMRYIRLTLGITTSDTINSLDQFHGAVVQAAKSYDFVNNTLAYRTKIYKYIKNTLKWDTTGSTVSAPNPEPSVIFTDMPAKGHWAYEAILWAYTSTPQITTGTSTTTFSPNNTVTRGEAVTFLWRAAGCPEPRTSTCPFRDVASGKFYYKAVLWAVEKGITSGTTATTFSPNANVKREQLLTFLWRYAGKPSVPNNSLPFTDVSSDRYYYKAILWSYWGGILVGNEGGSSTTKVQPKQDCTRAYAVTYLFNLFVMTAH